MSYSPLSTFSPRNSPPSTLMPFFSQRIEPSARHPTSNRRRRKLLVSYAPDWIITILLAGVFFGLNDVPGFKRSFSLLDTSLLHTFAEHERVPDVALYMICFVAPLVIQPVINLLTIRSFWDFHNATLGLVLGLAITGAFTQFTKITVGRPRPDVIARCMPPAGSVDPPYGLSTVAICTNTNQAIMIDGWRSFPSGHSSLSFAGLGFLAFYTAGKLHLFDKRGHAGKAWLSLTPLAGASLVAISRTMDYRHHWQDVLMGSILGLAMAYFSYRQYFPSLASEMSHRPYSPRVPREGDDLLPTHVQQSRPLNASNRHSYRDSMDNGSDDVELRDGTVRRGGPGPLEEVWREGDSESAKPKYDVQKTADS